MSSVFKKIFANASTRVLMLVFGFIIGITAFFLISGYYAQIRLYEEGELAKLSGIANTLSDQIDGTAHEILYHQYKFKDQITTTTQDHVYYEFHKKLKAAQLNNKLETAIYTMVYEPKENLFYFAVFSDTVYWRHPWEKFHPEHTTHYLTGGIVHPYTDENGTWLSAFAPIKNLRGEVIAAIQVDSRFDSFIAKARKEISIRAIISMSIISIIGFFLFKSVRSILKKEELMTLEIIESHALIEAKNKDITDSIQYAKRIQEAILPDTELIKKRFPESFILFLPRDIVSGDFYWYTERADRYYLAAVDCTGHGVPGALMSMIGNTLLNEAINNSTTRETGEILDLLDAGIKHALKQKDDNPETRDGMDLAIISIDKNFTELHFSGAFRPLLHLRKDQMEEIRADRFPIGGGNAYEKTKFTTHKLAVQGNDLIYLFSDGYPDQIGGEQSKKFMTKRFKDMIMKNKHLPLNKQGDIYRNELQNWQGDNEQMDDILFIGLQIPNNK